MYPDLPRNPRLNRWLELLPGTVSWFLILFPVWGSIVIPEAVAYYILAFAVYWLYRSVSLSFLATLSYYRIKASQAHDWMRDLQKLSDWQKVHHIIILPTYKEPIYIIERTLQALKNQTLPTKNLHIVIAFEEREGEPAKEKAVMLKEKYAHHFGSLIASFHPVLPNEVIGKSSNMSWAAKRAKIEIADAKKLDINYVTITSEDIDVQFDKQYYAALAYKFLTHPEREFRIWQPAILYYNNIWDIPSPIRVFSTTASIVQIGMLNRHDRLVNFSTYSLPLKLVVDIGYWDTDVIPEDYRMFFKAYFKTGGKVSVEPVFLPAYADAANAGGFWKTMVNQYEQVKRWAWGVSDDSWIIQQWLYAKKVPFWDKTIRVLKVLEDHFLWPVNWFAITIGAMLPPLLNEDFTRTMIGRRLPQTSSTILTIALIGVIVTLIIDWIQRPNKHLVPWYKKMLMPFEFLMLPMVGFFFSAVPGLDAHTRLLLGKYLEYRTTEKV